MMKKLLLTFVAVVSLVACATSVEKPEITVVPYPNELIVGEGTFVAKGAAVTYDEALDSASVKVINALAQRLSFVTGVETAVSAGQSDKGFVFVLNAEIPSEAYTLDVTPEAVRVEASGLRGFNYAVQTIRQLLPLEVFASEPSPRTKWTIPAVQIKDEPRFAYRGLHFDEGRHFFGVDEVKRYLDIMELHKLNTLHWHLTEDQGWRLEIKKYPLLTEKGQWRKETVVGSLSSGVYDGIPHGGYYTQEQVKELVKYAADRYVTIIPEIELPGHALAAIACYPELSCGLEDHYETATRWGIFKQVYCPKESTFKFLEDVFDEVFELFPSELVHIGGDECPKASWKACPHCQALIKKLGLKDEYELQSYFVTRMEKYINSKGRQIIGWDEILQGGLAPNAKVMSWLGEEGGIKAAQQHHEVVMSPHQKYYLDYWQADPYSEPLAMSGPTTLRTMYDYEPVPEVLTPEEGKYIIGVEGCVWTEYMPVPERVEYMAWPRMCAIAETGWTRNEKDWDGFTRRLEKHFGRLDGMDVAYCGAFYNPMIVFHKDTPHNMVVTMTVDAPGAEIHYTLDGSVPTADSPKYEIPFSINRSQTVTAAAYRNGRQIGEIKSKRF